MQNWKEKGSELKYKESLIVRLIRQAVVYSGLDVHLHLVFVQRGNLYFKSTKKITGLLVICLMIDIKRNFPHKKICSPFSGSRSFVFRLYNICWGSKNNLSHPNN